MRLRGKRSIDDGLRAVRSPRFLSIEVNFRYFICPQVLVHHIVMTCSFIADFHVKHISQYSS